MLTAMTLSKDAVVQFAGVSWVGVLNAGWKGVEGTDRKNP
jgi:hypothetical protein